MYSQKTIIYYAKMILSYLHANILIIANLCGIALCIENIRISANVEN